MKKKKTSTVLTETSSRFLDVPGVLGVSMSRQQGFRCPFRFGMPKDNPSLLVYSESGGNFLLISHCDKSLSVVQGEMAWIELILIRKFSSPRLFRLLNSIYIIIIIVKMFWLSYRGVFNREATKSKPIEGANEDLFFSLSSHLSSIRFDISICWKLFSN